MAKTNGQTRDDDVLDLDVLEADATLAPYRFRLGGRSYEMAHPSSLDWHHQTTFDQADMPGMLRVLLGDDDFEEFDRHQLAGFKLNTLFERWAEHCGIDPGELQASAGYSAPTAKPSRRTSVATTKSGSRTSRPAR